MRSFSLLRFLNLFALTLNSLSTNFHSTLYWRFCYTFRSCLLSLR
nr:MAG TPA: hypothetical protein [Caudoviricetes sp.]